MKKIYLAILLLILSINVQSQTVYEWYQDGIVIFQIKTDSKYFIPSEKHNVNLGDVEFLQKFIDRYGINEVNRILYYHPDEKLNHTFQINFDNANQVDNLIKDLSRIPFLEYAEKKELHVKFLVPNDMGAYSTNGTGMWHLHQVQADDAWDLSTGSSSVVVAVTDDAISTTHSDLTGKFVAGNDASDQNSTDPNPCGGNDGNHGTHVSGTVGAKTNNGAGTSSSIGWNVSIMPVKIGRCSDGALTAGYEGLAWAANNGADVINMSWGGGGSSNFGQNTANAAAAQGAILVAASGNDNVTSIFYPAGYNNVISVASTTTNDSKSSFSNYGTWIDISSPGSSIRSTVANGSYDRYDGTSMASPNVSSLLGLMKSYAPNATNADLISCLYSSADPVTSNAGQMGAGRINAFAALQCVSAFAFQNDVGITEIISPETTICGNSFTPQIVLRNFGSNTLNSVTINYTWGAVNANFNWTGTLTTGQTTTINLPVQTSASSGSFTFTATTNLGGDQNTSNNSSSKAFLIDPNGQTTTFFLTTDCYGSEITWQIENSANTVVASGGPYTDVSGGQNINTSICLPVGCYTFTINDSYGDGMNGSQWNSCSVDGDYSMVDGNGANLFQMTAANGDFGNSTFHNFCISSPSVSLDAGISEIIAPNGVLCTGTIAPQVRIRNYGSSNLNSATITYNVGGANQNFNWTGNLSTGQTEVVTLPNITAGSGSVTFTSATVSPNGSSDQNNANNQSQSVVSVFANAQSLPFTESFESNTFNNGTWSLSNPDNDVTWELVPVTGTTPGSTAAKMDFFNYAQSSQRDGMITPLLNFNGQTSINMTFEHAYRRFNQSTTDSLIVYVSTNCGANWQRVFARGEDATGSFATATTNTAAFNPANSGEWCLGTVGSDCYSIDLTSFAGNNVLIKFEGFNSGTVGNNLYVDNINITGTSAPFSADFTASTQTVCPGQQITYTDQSSGAISSRAWSFPGGTPSTSSAVNPVVTYNTAGTYNASLTISGTPGSDTQTKTNYITVNVAPNVSISSTGSSCSGTNAILTANATAGSGSITGYQWLFNGNNVGSSQPTLSVNNPGNYSVVVTNSNGCSTTSSVFNFTQFIAPTVSITGSNNFCPGGSTLLTANANAGSGTILSYQWQLNGSNIGGNQSTFNAQLAGDYTVTVTNSNNCSTTSSVFTVSLNTAPSVSISGGNGLCNGGSTNLTANATAGSGSITNYQWKRDGVNVGSNSNTYTATFAGSYSVSVTNSNGCSTSSSIFEVTDIAQFNVTVQTVNANCGTSDGSASANVNGVTSGYTFVWNTSPTVTGPNLANVSAGSYSITVTETATGCSQTENFFIGNIGAPTIDSLSIIHATCFNGNLGSAQAFVSGGNGGYTYDFGFGVSANQSALNIIPGTYILTVFDAAGCQTSANFEILNNGNPIIDSVYVLDATCPSLADGAIEVFPNNSGYLFSWSTGNTSQNINGLAAGNYDLIISNVNGCSSNISEAVGNTYNLDVNLNITDNSAIQGNSSITALPSGGIAPYNYSWNNGTLNGQTIDFLNAGQYILLLTDNNGCSIQDTATIGSVGIRELAWLEDFNLYPNPTKGALHLSLNLLNTADVQLEVYSVLGRKVWQENLSNFKSGILTISGNELASGTYLLRILSEGETVVLPFSKVD